MNKEIRCVLIRHDDDGAQTLGKLLVMSGLRTAEFATLEPSWQHNKQRLSCIPWGRYTIRKRWSEKYGWHLHVQDVRGREWILMHVGNFRDDSTGCILIGYNHVDLNGDGALDVTQSKMAMADLLKLLPDRCTLDIVPVLP